MNKNNLNEYILIKTLALCGNDDCADISCNQIVYDNYISELKSHKINKDGHALLDYRNHDHHCNVKLYIEILNTLADDEILIGNDIGVNEHIIKIK